MPVYLDFMLVFGGQSDAKDLRFSGFREQIRLKAPDSGHSAPELARSVKHFQICYNLKGVQHKKEDAENAKLDEWSVRDTAIYHRFDVEYGTALWIVTKGGRDLRDRYADLTTPMSRPDKNMYNDPTSCFRTTLMTHLLYCQWSTEDWRWYILYLEGMVEQEVSVCAFTRICANFESYRVIWRSTGSVLLVSHIDSTRHGKFKIYNIGKTKPTKRSWS